ncbi:hypothetical protein F5B22DRAFT_627872 [Xylaria bambusicola]|uniref:uncharacterized protein n=1 Tax=Xylaria bambusicola TaxID=326684 RepID=UPI002007EBBD|nr:uncharacterized protein F5B22DRAFT_627872 [Xylaria bambusicola]KAI0505473.1 hypothetical protein F5B22DRAFT_627872 [Xylaria bambusicola]
MSGELALAVLGLVEGSIKLVRKIKSTCQSYREADEGVKERFVLLESLWIKVEMQLEFLAKISSHLTDDLVQSQLNLLQRLKGRLAQAASQLEAVDPRSIENKGKAADVLRKWKFALVKSSLDELMGELEAWQQRFDPSWYLMILISGKVLDNALVESADSDLAQSDLDSNPLNKMLAIRSTLNPGLKPQSKTHVNLSHDGLKGAQESAISFSAARTVVRAGSTNLLVVERVSCPSGMTSQMKIDVGNLAKKLQNVDPTTFGLLRCKGILKHHDALNKLSAIDVVYTTPLNCQQPQTLRHHLSQQKPVSLSMIMRIAKQLVRSVHYVHTCGFVHKNIRPENILIFPGSNNGSLGESFLIGFTEFRNANFQTNLYGDAAWHRNIYRHPQRQGPFVLDRYVMQHDIYSIGVCLLEIALWRSFVWYPAPDGSATPVPSMGLGFACDDKDFETTQLTSKRRIKEQLVRLAEEELPPRVGDTYMSIVVDCMKCLDPDSEKFGDIKGLADEDGIVVGVKYVEHILGRIMEISV